jgi:thymidylate kinase
VDRYYLDWVVNLALLQQNSCGKVLRDARWLERLLPKAQLHLFLDVAEETAFQRKNDIQSVQYLRERKELYLDLAPHYGFQVVDANQDPETVFRQVKALVEITLDPSPAAALIAPAVR